MPRNLDLHGNAPDKSNVALLLIDIISDFEFEDGEKLFKHFLPMARKSDTGGNSDYLRQRQFRQVAVEL